MPRSVIKVKTVEVAKERNRLKDICTPEQLRQIAERRNTQSGRQYKLPAVAATVLKIELDPTQVACLKKSLGRYKSKSNNTQMPTPTPTPTPAPEPESIPVTPKPVAAIDTLHPVEGLDYCTGEKNRADQPSDDKDGPHEACTTLGELPAQSRYTAILRRQPDVQNKQMTTAYNILFAKFHSKLKKADTYKKKAAIHKAFSADQKIQMALLQTQLEFEQQSIEEQKKKLAKAQEKIRRLERENNAYAQTINKQAADTRHRMNAMATLLGLVSTNVETLEGEDWKTRCKEYVKLVDPEAPELVFSWDTSESSAKSGPLDSNQASNIDAASNSRQALLRSKPRGVKKLTSMAQTYLPKWVKFLHNIRPAINQSPQNKRPSKASQPEPLPHLKPSKHTLMEFLKQKQKNSENYKWSYDTAVKIAGCIKKFTDYYHSEDLAVQIPLELGKREKGARITPEQMQALHKFLQGKCREQPKTSKRQQKRLFKAEAKAAAAAAAEAIAAAADTQMQNECEESKEGHCVSSETQCFRMRNTSSTRRTIIRKSAIQNAEYNRQKYLALAFVHCTGCRLNEAAYVVYNHKIEANQDRETKDFYPYIAKMPAQFTKTDSDYTWYIPTRERQLAEFIQITNPKWVCGNPNAPQKHDDLLEAFRRSLEYWMEKAVKDCGVKYPEHFATVIAEPINARSLRQYRGHQYILYRNQALAAEKEPMPNPLQHTKLSKVTERNYGGINLSNMQEARQAVLKGRDQAAKGALKGYYFPGHTD